MFIRIFLILASLTFSYNAFAEGACSEPVEPACTSNADTFKDKKTYETCTKELEEMSKKTKEYAACLKTELQKTAEDVQKKSETAADKTNAIIKKFNCKADPKAACDNLTQTAPPAPAPAQ
jgi:membrane-anchored protein YejM (alkaline phosphatase superfamily)